MKKKIALSLLLICACLFLTGCGCSRKEYSVAFNTDGGSAVSTQIVKKGDKITKPADPTREGYTFVGWYVNVNDIQPYDFSKEVTGNLKLTAKWVQGSVCNLTCSEGYTLDTTNCSCVKESEAKEVESITLDKTSVTIVVGKSTTVKATVKPADATNKTLTWTSSDESVATVDSNGKITAKKVGTAKITVKAGSKSKTITVTVKTQDKYNLDNVKLTAKTITKAGANLNDYKATGCTITLTSATPSNNNTTVTNGSVTKLYRNTSNDSITAVYHVTCGSEKKDVTVKHTVSASSYKYTANVGGVVPIITVDNGATGYTLACNRASGLKFVSAVGGVQFPGHENGMVYTMQFDNDNATTYVVVAK